MSSYSFNNVSENINVQTTDYNEKYNLRLFNSNKNENDQFLQGVHGLVFQGEKLILQTFGHTTDLTSESPLEDFKDYLFWESHEGSLIRLFCVNDMWFVSTHKKLDAFKSKWSCRKSFGELFVDEVAKHFPENSLHSFTNTLDKNYAYVFLLKNNDENRIVCSNQGETCYFIGKYLEGVKLDLTQDEKIPFPQPKKLEFGTLEELQTFVKEVNPKYLQGVIGFKLKDGVCEKIVKVLNVEYKRLFELRGNEPNLLLRYLQVRQTLEEDDFKELYSSHKNLFERFEKNLLEASYRIHNSYIKRYVEKQYIQVPAVENFVMKKCHEFHVQNRHHNIITKAVVLSILNKQEPSVLYQFN